MTVSPEGIALIKRGEGFRATLYWDIGRPCVGFGCDLAPVDVKDYIGRTITEEEGSALMQGRLLAIEEAITKHVKVPITQNQFDAIADFTYNIGVSAFLASTLMRKINAQDLPSAADEFMRWIHADGLVSPSLEARRKEERALFLRN